MRGNFTNPTTQRYFAKDGLASNLVEQIAVDKLGFIWIATSRGLNKFDGVNFIHYRVDTNDEYSLSNDYVRCLFIDDDNNIWVGTKGGGLNYFNRSTGKFTHYIHDENDETSISNNEILNIFRDSKGRLWVGTEGGLNLFEDSTKEFTRFLSDKTDPYTLPQNAVLKIFEDKDQNIWIGTWNGGLTFIEEGTSQDRPFTFHTSKHNPKDPTSIGSNHCWEIASDKNGVLWVGLYNSGASLIIPSIPYEKGNAELFVRGLKFVNYKSSYDKGEEGLSHHNVCDIEFTEDNEVLFGTTHGLSVLDYSCIDLSKSWKELNEKRTDLVFANRHSSDNYEAKFGEVVIRSIFKSKDGNIWFATYNGIVKASNSNRRFKTFLNTKTNKGEFCKIRSIEYSKYQYYNAITNHGILRYYPGSDKFEKIAGFDSLADDMLDYITCIHEDDDRTLWLGSHKGLFRKKANSDKVECYSDQLDQKQFFHGQKIDKIYQDKTGNLWLSADFGIAELNPTTDELIIHGDPYNDPYGIGMQGVSGITEDDEGNIWFSHLGLGIVRFKRVNGKNTALQFGFSNANAKHNLSSKFARAIDYKDGNLWIGTELGLSKYNIKTDMVTNYDLPELKEHLSGRILSLVTDKLDGIWITLESEKAELICFNQKNEKVSRYGYNNGLPQLKFLLKSYHKSKGGKITFGSNSGFTSFYGESIVKQIDVPSVTITNLATLDQTSEASDIGHRSHTVIHNDVLNNADGLELSHEQNQIKIEFAVLDFRFSNSFEYAYRLEGLHDDWVHLGSENKVSFTGLAPGRYVFKVKAKNQDGYWSNKVTSLDLMIDCPWYQSWLAYFVFAVLFVLAAYAFYIRKTKIAQKEKIQLEMLVEDRTSALKSITLKEKQARIAAEMMKDEAHNAQQRAEAANLAKSQFLANMSHEIRTPMNGILGMLQLLNNTTLNTEQSDYVRTSTESAMGLIRIINDILDFSKVESDKIEIEKEKVDIHTIIENVIDLNAANCQEKDIEISYLIEPTVPRIIIGDEVRIRQILTNLLSNAIKFTNRGDISMMVSVDPSAASSKNNLLTDLKFIVKDTGIGISKDKISQLFQAFSQVDASITRKFGGTGLGLAISRKLARLMNGDVTLESKQGVGTEVSFTLSCEFDSSSLNRLNNQFPLQNKSAAIITKSAVGGKSLVNILESTGINSFSMSREVTREFLDDLINNPVDVLFIDSAFFTPSTEIHLNRVKSKTNTKVILNVPILFPSLETKCVDATTSKPFKKSNVLSTLYSIFNDSTVNVDINQKVNDRLHPCGKKQIGSDVFNDKFAQTSPLNILVAEDHKINQMLIKKVLNKLGYNPIIVENGKLAIEESLKSAYDIIFMDIQMPVLDGLAATKEIINNWDSHQKPFIIAMTANAMKGDREKYISSGMHDYISKPFLIHDLQIMLKKYSHKKYGQGENGCV